MLSILQEPSLMKVHGHEWPGSKISQHAGVCYNHITTYKEQLGLE